MICCRYFCCDGVSDEYMVVESWRGEEEEKEEEEEEECGWGNCDSVNVVDRRMCVVVGSSSNIYMESRLECFFVILEIVGV